MLHSKRIFFAVLLVVGPLSWIACSKKEEPPPTPTAEEPEEKPKKKKKKVDDEDITDVGAANGEEVGTPTPGGTWKPGTKKTDGGSATSDADKQKLIACCTALKNSAALAGAASAAASAAPIPGVPPPPPMPPKDELDKAAKECDKAVANWNGDLNTSLKGVKGATAVKLPGACMISG